MQYKVWIWNSPTSYIKLFREWEWPLATIVHFITILWVSSVTLPTYETFYLQHRYIVRSTRQLFFVLDDSTNLTNWNIIIVSLIRIRHSSVSVVKRIAENSQERWDLDHSHPVMRNIKHCLLFYQKVNQTETIWCSEEEKLWGKTASWSLQNVKRNGSLYIHFIISRGMYQFNIIILINIKINNEYDIKT